jgi:dynein heavy chain
MSDTMTMFFEAEDLEQASPATVSRVGMIFCETRNIGWQAVRNIWLKTLPKEFPDIHVTQLKNLFDWQFPVLTYFISKFCKLPYVLSPQILIFSVTRILTSMFKFSVTEKGEKDKFKYNTTGACEFPADVEKFIEGCFIYAMIWSVGVAVDSNGRKKFDAYMRLLLKGEVFSTPEYIDFKIKTPEYNYDDGTKKMSTSFPDEGLVYDYNFDRKRGIWMNWFDGLPTFKIPRESKFNSIVIPTIDTIRNEWLLETLLVNGYHVLCTGDTGTGKSVCIKNKLFGGMPQQYNSISLNFSARTSANQAQDAIDSKLDKRRKGVLGPPLGMKTVVFVDDLNMPAKEIYGAQPPIEILRQWMDHQGWYDRKENEFRRLVDIQFCAAMGPPGGGRTRITQRYVRHFNVINFVNFSDESLTRVFGTILEWRFQQGFSSSIQKVSKQTVNATVAVYNQLSARLLPTPLKSHYTFNLRDLSKVFQGILLGDPSLIKVKSEYLRLWSHECMRVFHDRLIDDIDRNWFKSLLSTTVKDIFNDDFEKIKGKNNNILFGNFGDAKSTIKIYQELDDRDKLPDVMNSYLTDYNESNTTGMNLVLFESAIEHISRISRIINQPYGNALLVGVGGSGRKSLTTLAVFIAEFELFKIEITKSYGVFEWREDIKKMMTTAGVDNSPTVFMMDDTQIVNESFLEDINGILNTGEIANLFLPDEWAVIVENLMKACQEAGVNSGITTEVYNFFVSRVRTNLHLVLCLSPIGEAFRTRLRMFPSLVNCCTIDWFSEWPEDALHMCAIHFLKGVELPVSVKSGVVDVCVDMQVRVVQLSKKFLDVMGRHYYVTPTSYLELINTFKSLLSIQRQEVIDGKERYDNGLMKLRETADQVNDMQEYLEDLQPKLKAATIATDALLIRITADRVVANEKSVVVEADAAVCNEQATQAKALKDTCEAELGKALPALKSAEQALKSLDKSDIVEMKVMKKPSAAIKMTMAAICILFKVKPDRKVKDGDPRVDPFWGPATKELLGDSHFLKKLQTFDKDKMDPDIVAKVKGFTDDPDFDPEVVAKKGSVAAAGLARWVHAMVQYERVFRIVAPKKKSLKEAESKLKIAKAELKQKTDALKEVLDKVASLEAALQDAEDTKEKLKNQVIDCEKKLVRADALIQGLGGEKIRWTEMSAKLETKFVNITGDIVISSGLIAYMGAFMSNYREDAIEQWSQLLNSKGIPCSSNFNLRDTLGSPLEISGWIIKKLPNDSFSIDNGIMMKRSNRWPLFIDPQLQANKWIKKMEEPNSLKVVKQNQTNFVRILENAVQFGNPVILENVPETLDPILESILLKQIVVIGGMATIRFGDATIEYDKNFRLYITTKLRNPHYPPELCVKVNLLNFMATSEGLQDQMLGRVVALEQKELEAQRLNLVIDDAEYQRILKEIEDKILNMLKNAEGNILDDEVLIDALGESKKTANLIQEKVKIAETTQNRISKVRRGYIPVAAQSSQLFFCISDLATVDPMYQYSLEWYISLFETAIETADKAKNLDDRLKNLNQCFTKILYNNVCRSLFEKDKLLFSFLLATKILLGENLLDPIELRFFLQGNTSMDLTEVNPYKSWLHDKIWGDILAIKELPAFLPFFDLFKLKSNEHKWQEVISSNSPIDLITSIVGDSYNPFQKICILRCIRLDFVVPAVQEFISNNIGARFIEPPTFNMKQCFEDSKSTTPLIFVLTPGAAPMSELYKLAEELGFENRLVAISLGQGQGPLAENAIADAATKGTWICLQNCHLSISWLPTLEKICEEFSEDSLHPSFRLWLTSEPTEHFPAFVLQNGIKMTNEPPKGMRANLLGSLIQVDETWYETCERKEEFKKILFGLCFFHAAVRERRKFGPLGWNISYIFSLPDLKISMDQLRIFLDEMRPEDPIPFAALAYLVGECNYGGRVTDDKDRRCIMNILDDFYNPSILSDDYRFSPSGTYYAPVNTNLHLCKEFVRSLPFNEGPEVFGLHDNANITCAISETNLLLDTALSLQPRVQQGEGKNWGDKLDELAQDINIRIPIPFDVEKALITFPVKYEESMNTVLTQELLRFNGLTIEITTTLVEIRKALKGLVVMSLELEEMGNSMVIGKVPNMWSKISYPSLKPLGSWVFDLLERLAFLKEWVDIEESPNVFWISGFFFTQAFITGTLQNFARRHAIPIDKAEFDFRVLKSDEMKDAIRKKPDDGAYIKGLYLEGAIWNTIDHVLDESLPRELYVEMPCIHLFPKEKSLIPVVKGIPEQYTGATNGTCHMYMCPVYKTSFRQGVLSTTGHSTNFVMMIRLPMSQQHVQKHWIKRGVAMLTQLDF